MSLADELKESKEKLDKKKTEGPVKKKKKRRSSRRQWSKDNELIALYLYRKDASNFLKANYAEKRDVSSRAMALRISMFEALNNGIANALATEQSKEIYREFGSIQIEDLETKVISILRGEWSLA